MTLYDLTKKYGEGKGEGMMWTTLRLVSDAIDASMTDDKRCALMRDLYGKMSGGHYNQEYAVADVEKMYYVDGDDEKHYAPYWTEPQVNAVYESIQDDIPSDYNCWDFYVALQMTKADNYMLVKHWFPALAEPELDKKLVEMAVAWLDDPDSPYGTKKVWEYMNAGK